MIILQITSGNNRNSYELGIVGPNWVNQEQIVLNTSDKKYWSDYKLNITSFKLELIYN